MADRENKECEKLKDKASLFVIKHELIAEIEDKICWINKILKELEVKIKEVKAAEIK
jgi:hypothetical protein